MKKMTVEEVIDKLANTKIYTRGMGVKVINKIYPPPLEIGIQGERIRSIPVLRVN